MSTGPSSRRTGLPFGIGVVSVTGHSLVAAGGASRGAALLRQFELPATSLTLFGYTQAQLDAAIPNGLTVDDQPAIGSGLIALGGGHYLGITDRGPNIDHFPDTTPPCDSGSANGKTHPLPQFTPAIVEFHAHDGRIDPVSIVNLVGNGGVPVTGLSNFAPDDDPSFTNPCTAASVFNVNGMDVEDFAPLPGGRFIGVEENRPSIFIGVLGTGLIEKRYIPTSQLLPGAAYTVQASLPEVLKTRSKNRGFEAVAVTPDLQTAYTMTQSPLEVGCAGGTGVCRNGRVLRILKLDVSNPYDIRVTGQYVYRMSDPAVYPAGNNARALKLSAMSWVAPDKLLLLERSDEPGIGGVRLVLVDLRGATDINGQFDASLVPEQTAGAGIPRHVSARVVFEEFENQPAGQRIFWTYKLEGMTIRNSNVVDIINDNDFGIIGPPNNPPPTSLWSIRLEDQLPLGK